MARLETKRRRQKKTDEIRKVTKSSDLPAAIIMDSDLDKIWEENTQIKNALQTIEANLLNVNKALEKIEQTFLDKDAKFDNAIKAFENKIDSRISLEVEIIKKDLDSEVKKISNRFNDKLTNLKYSFEDKMKEFEECQMSQTKVIDEKLRAFEIQITNENEIWKREKADWQQEKEDWQQEKEDWQQEKEDWQQEKEELLKRMKDNAISNNSNYVDLPDMQINTS